MIENNPLFTKESFEVATSYISNACFTLIYDGNDTLEQKKAGKELLQAEWLLATVIDHIFDYYPASYFMNDDDRREYPEYLEWFLNHPAIGVRNAIRFVENNFAMLETVTRDEYNQHRIPRRDMEKEIHAKKVLVEIQNNLDEIMQRLNSPKKVTDHERPTEQEISMLIHTIKKVQENYGKMADDRCDRDFSLQIFQYNKMLEMYKLPLLKAWEVYHYGWHSDFWEEGDSMFEYMMFEMKAKEMIRDLANSLQEQSPFAAIERNSAIINGLLKVYNHLLKQNLE